MISLFPGQKISKVGGSYRENSLVHGGKWKKMETNFFSKLRHTLCVRAQKTCP